MAQQLTNDFQPMLFLPQTSTVRITKDWHIIKDGDAAARAVFDTHYSRYRYADGRRPKLFVGPGEKLVLSTQDYSAIWVWRYFEDDWHNLHVGAQGEKSLWNSIFHNQSPLLSSNLIRQAELVAACRWPGEPRFTYVNPKKIQSDNPGCCFKKAGWKKIAETAKGLHVLRAG